jgi:hypothetical protein
MADLETINSILRCEFASLDALLTFYRKKLPGRTAGYHQEEVGPVMFHNVPGEADHFVAKQFHLGESTMDMSAGLDWYATPNGDLEWNGGLVRHGYFMLLAAAYRQTGDERYAAAIIEHMLDYIDRVPPFNPEGQSYLNYKRSTWRPFEVAGRAAETWPEALAKIIDSPSMTPVAWAKILYSLYEHGIFLAMHHWRTGNHACLETAALGLLGIFFREFKTADEWLRYAIDFLLKTWPEQFHSDGYTKEMSGGYHWVAMRGFFTLYEVAVANGFEKLFPPLYKERLVVTSRAELLQSKPDYGVPTTNDSNTGINRREQLVRIDRLLAIAEIEGRLSAGAARTLPPTSWFYPEARVGIMRSDWSAKAHYLAFDMGRWGANHMNEDQLNIEVSALGRKFLVNSGRWRYTTSPDGSWMDRAKYFKTTAAYNGVLVNGYSQMPGDATGTMAIHEDYDYAIGVFKAGYGEEASARDGERLGEEEIEHGKVRRVQDVVHQREVIFIKPVFWVLRDSIWGKNVKRAEQIWHFFDGEVISQPGSSFVVTRFEDANLIIASLGAKEIRVNLFNGSTRPFRGWHCPCYDQLRPAPELSYLQDGEERITFHTLIFPVSGKITTLPVFKITTKGYCVSYRGANWEISAPENQEWRLLN